MGVQVMVGIERGHGGDRGALTNGRADRWSKGRWMHFVLLMYGSDLSVE
jgi:hypothetical protein